MNSIWLDLLIFHLDTKMTTEIGFTWKGHNMTPNDKHLTNFKFKKSYNVALSMLDR